MVDLGIKQKDLFKSEAKVEKDYDNQMVYPEISVSGKLAERMGAADLDDGDVVQVPVVLKVKRLSKTTTDGKTDYSLTLCVLKMGDMEEAPDQDDDDEGGDLPDRPAGALAALHMYPMDDEE